MNKVEIFDPAMCCSTGVCGPGVDPELLRVATILNTLEGAGYGIARYGLSQNPQAFVDNEVINDALINGGTEALPITLVNGEIKQTGGYPSNSDLAEWAGMPKKELVSLLLKEKQEKGCCCGGDSGCC